MIVRLAKLTDLSDIVALGAKLVPLTNYGPLGYNAVIARRVVKEAMTSKYSRVWITEDKGKITGLLIGEIGPMTTTAKMGATDLAFIADQGGDLLLDAFVDWCKLRKVSRIDMGISAGPEREEAIKRVMRRKGFVYSGPMFHMNLGVDRECVEENPQGG